MPFSISTQPLVCAFQIRHHFCHLWTIAKKLSLRLLIHCVIKILGLCISGIFIDREAREIMYLVASVRLSVCPSVTALTAEQQKAEKAEKAVQGVCLCVE